MNEIAAIFLRPQDFICLSKIKKKIFTKVADFSTTFAPSDEPIPFEKTEELTYKPIKKGQRWAKPFGCAWFKAEGNIPLNVKGKKIVALISIGGEGLVYEKGELKGTVTNILSLMDVVQATPGKRMIDITNSSQGGEKIELLIDGGFNGTNGTFVYGGRLSDMTLNIFNETAYKYYYDFLTLSLLVFTEKENEKLTKERKNLAITLMHKSYSLFCKGKEEEAVKTIGAFFDKERDYQDVVYTAIGHAHLDLAWLWPIRETKRKGMRTLQNACNYLEKYPDYVFGVSQAALLNWIEEGNIKLFEKVRDYVQKGRIEIQGNMWVECDCNIPCGESLIRQFYYGDEYFINKMGANSKVVWLPDVFGFPSAMPKIISGVGKKYFVTIKLSWNIYNKFPLQTFNWVGDDGSKIIAHIAPEGNYVSTGSPIALTNAQNRNVNKETGKALLIYGVGDGGAGPGDGHLEVLNRVEKLYEVNKVEKNSSESFFNALKIEQLTDYEGELYLEKHQGTLTSQAKIKLYNRLMERNLHNLEFLLALNDLSGKILDKYWKETLLYQFHDILPGSSINRVNKEAVERYEVMYSDLMEITDVLLSKLKGEKKLCALNPTSFARQETVEYQDAYYNVEMEPFGIGEMKVKENEDLFFDEQQMTVENEFYKIKLGKNGEFYKMHDKIFNKELILGKFNELLVYQDPKMYYNAWDIKRSYLNTLPQKPRMASRSIINNNTAIIINQSFVYDKSIIRQKITLSGKVIKFDNIVTWNEKHKMLRVNFTPTIVSDKADCDIQFGEIKRSTKNETSVEKAQYEICAHKYLAFSDEELIFGVMSDCKYGYRAKEGVISMNLLRSPKYPDKECDIGTHNFGYAIVTAKDKEELTKYAYCYDNPPIISEYALQLPKLFEIEKKNAIIETIKPWYNGQGIAVRIYERYGREENLKLTPIAPYNKMFTADLLENIITEVKDNTVHLAPHKIITVIFTK